jgi:protein PET117
MSRASQITLATTCATAIGVVAFVHFSQQADKAAMHAGVIRDYEQQRVKRERQADFEMQKELQEEYLKYQTVHDSSTPEPPQAQPGK